VQFKISNFDPRVVDAEPDSNFVVSDQISNYIMRLAGTLIGIVIGLLIWFFADFVRCVDRALIADELWCLIM
jgi:hypothetical protein